MGGLSHLRRAGIGIAFAVGIVAFAPTVAPAPAQAGASVTVSPSSTPAGGTVRFSGVVPTGCEGDVTLTSTAALFAPDGFGPQAPRDAMGAFQVNFQVPGSTPPGTYTVGVRCGGGNVGVSTSLMVTSAPAAPMRGAPRTTG
jgi:hypothetical protein